MEQVVIAMIILVILTNMTIEIINVIYHILVFVFYFYHLVVILMSFHYIVFSNIYIYIYIYNL